MDEVRPSFQSRSVKTTAGASTSIAANAFPPDSLQASQDPLVSSGSVNIPLVNNRKGSLLPRAPGPGAGPSKLRLSLSGPGDVAARSLAESRLNRARSLPVKYRYHPSNAMLLSHSRHCRLPPLWDASASNPACTVPIFCFLPPPPSSFCCMMVHPAGAAACSSLLVHGFGLLVQPLLLSRSGSTY